MKQLIEGADLISHFTTETIQTPPRLIDLNLFLYDFFNDAQSSLGQEHHLQLVNCCSGLSIYSDAKLLRQVLRDLLLFSVHSASDAEAIRLEISFQNERIVFSMQSVTCAGVQRNSSNGRELSEPIDGFTRISGVELRLASLKRYTDALGGQISLESDGRERSCFRVTLPLHPPSGSRERPRTGDRLQE